MLKWFKIFLWVWALLPLTSARAFVDPPTFEPAQPVAGQPVRMSVRAGGCHVFGGTPPGYPFVEVIKNARDVKIIVFGAEIYDPMFCISPPGVLNQEIGPLDSGEYDVTIQIRDRLLPYPVGPVLASSRLTVVPRAQPTVIPAVKGWGLAGLGLAILVAAGAVFRRQMMALALVGVMLGALPSAPAQAQEPHPVVWAELEPGGGAPGAGMLCKITA